MNWEAIGAIGDVVGAIGVVVTLVYLAFQIGQNTFQLEQNTLATRAEAVSRSNVTIRENRIGIINSEEIAKIFQTGNSDPNNLSDLDRLRHRLMILNVTDAMMDIYTQTYVTKFAPETWNTQGVAMVERILGTPGGRLVWSNFSHTYPQDFRTAVDQIISAGE
jgi:hypothetical protein